MMVREAEKKILAIPVSLSAGNVCVDERARSARGGGGERFGRWFGFGAALAINSGFLLAALDDGAFRGKLGAGRAAKI